MKQNSSLKALPFFFISFFCLFLRSILIGFPNIEPVSSSIICLGKKFNFTQLFLFGFLNILFFDILTFRFGTWTFFTALTYAAVGLGTYFIKQNKIHYLTYSIVSTLIYDVITGLIIGPVLLNQEFKTALIGQIPFSIFHVLGNLAFTLLFTYALELFFVTRLAIILKSEKYYNVR